MKSIRRLTALLTMLGMVAAPVISHADYGGSGYGGGGYRSNYGGGYRSNYGNYRTSPSSNYYRGGSYAVPQYSTVPRVYHNQTPAASYSRAPSQPGYSQSQPTYPRNQSAHTQGQPAYTQGQPTYVQGGGVVRTSPAPQPSNYSSAKPTTSPVTSQSGSAYPSGSVYQSQTTPYAGQAYQPRPTFRDGVAQGNAVQGNAVQGNAAQGSTAQGTKNSNQAASSVPKQQYPSQGTSSYSTSTSSSSTTYGVEVSNSTSAGAKGSYAGQGGTYHSSNGTYSSSSVNKTSSVYSSNREPANFSPPTPQYPAAQPETVRTSTSSFTNRAADIAVSLATQHEAIAGSTDSAYAQPSYVAPAGYYQLADNASIGATTNANASSPSYASYPGNASAKESYPPTDRSRYEKRDNQNYDREKYHKTINNTFIGIPGWGLGVGWGWGWDRPGWGLGNHFRWGWNNAPALWGVAWHRQFVPVVHHSWHIGTWSNPWCAQFYQPLPFMSVAVATNPPAIANIGVAYCNPCFESLPMSFTAIHDYSIPLSIKRSQSSPGGAIHTIDATAPQIDSARDSVVAAKALFEKAKKLFQQGLYDDSLKLVEQAIQADQKDLVLHEVRALNLFALARYDAAAAVLNAMLGVAPGMDWTSVSNFYGSDEAYRNQLRKLEKYASSNRTDPASHFVLAYHYLVAGFDVHAATALRTVVANNSRDVVAARLLETISASTNSSKSNSTTADNRLKTDLVGTWKATADKTTILLTIDAKGDFTWIVQGDTKAETKLTGRSTTLENLLNLQSNSEGTIAGKVVAQNENAFDFFLTGTPHDLPAINFQRQITR